VVHTKWHTGVVAHDFVLRFPSHDVDDMTWKFKSSLIIIQGKLIFLKQNLASFPPHVLVSRSGVNQPLWNNDVTTISSKLFEHFSRQQLRERQVVWVVG